MATDATEYDISLKMLLFGPEGAGKTSLWSRYADDTFTHSYITTMHISFRIKTIELSNGKKCKLQIWDTPGLESLRPITTSYFRNDLIVIIVVALDDSDWNQHIQTYFDIARKEGTDDMDIAVVGNKTDEDRVVSFAEISKEVKGFGMPYYEVSSKTGDNVDATFENIVHYATKGVFKFKWNDKANKFGKKN